MKIKILLLTLCFSASTFLNAQNKGEAVAAGIAGAAAIGAIAFQMNQIIEMWELSATEYVLNTRPEISEFQVKLNNGFSGGTKWSDVSSLSILTFNVTYSKYQKGSSDKEVLMMFLDNGYMTEYGIDLTLVNWRFLKKEEWDIMMGLYLSCAIGLDVIDDDRVFIRERVKRKKEFANYSRLDTVINENRDTIIYGKSNKYVPIKNIRIGSRDIYYSSSQSMNSEDYAIVPLQKLKGDTYIRKPFEKGMEIIYNEKSMGIYLKETGKLVQLNRNVVNDIHTFLNN